MATLAVQTEVAVRTRGFQCFGKKLAWCSGATMHESCTTDEAEGVLPKGEVVSIRIVRECKGVPENLSGLRKVQAACGSPADADTAAAPPIRARLRRGFFVARFRCSSREADRNSKGAVVLNASEFLSLEPAAPLPGSAEEDFALLDELVLGGGGRSRRGGGEVSKEQSSDASEDATPSISGGHHSGDEEKTERHAIFAEWVASTFGKATCSAAADHGSNDDGSSSSSSSSSSGGSSDGSSDSSSDSGSNIDPSPRGVTTVYDVAAGKGFLTQELIARWAAVRRCVCVEPDPRPDAFMGGAAGSGGGGGGGGGDKDDGGSVVEWAWEPWNEELAERLLGPPSSQSSGSSSSNNGSTAGDPGYGGGGSDTARPPSSCRGVLLVGLHPDQATEAIVDAALARNLPFAVVPCCVFPGLFFNRHCATGSRTTRPAASGGGEGGPGIGDGSGAGGTGGRRYERQQIPLGVTGYRGFLSYLRAKDPTRVRLARLPFAGKNIVVYSAAAS